MPATLGTQRIWAPPTRGIRYGVPRYAQPYVPPPNASPLPAPPLQQQWVLSRGIMNPVVAARMRPPAIQWATDYATGTLTFGGSSYDFLSQLGVAPPQQQAWTLRYGARNQRQMALRAPMVQYATPVLFVDASSGAWIFAGSRVEAKIGADAATGNLIWGGSRTESATFSQTATGTLIFTGSESESFSRSRVQIAAFIRV